MEEGQRWRQYVIAGIANLACTSTGICLGWTSPVLPMLQDLAQSPLPEVITIHQGSWIGSVMGIGAMFGPFLGGYLTSAIGRKWSLLSSTILLFIGWILIAAATDINFIYAGRLFCGLTAGMTLAVVPMYCAEIASDKDRGSIGSLLMVFLILGMMLVYIVGSVVSYSVLIYMCISVASAFAILFYFIPDSPIYHLTKNDRDSAAESLSFIRGKSLAGVQNELDLMMEEVKASRQKTGMVTDLFKSSNLKALFISISMMAFLMFSGVDALGFYMTSIFEVSGLGIDPYMASNIVSIIQVVLTCVSAALQTRMGRRIPLMASCATAAVGLCLLSVYFLLVYNESPVVDSISFLPVLALGVYTIGYCFGLGPLSWTIIGEVFSVEVRPLALPVVTSLQWLFSFLVTRYFSPIGEAVGYHVPFFFFTATCVVAFFFVLFILPETKGKSFQEIQDILAGRTTETKPTNQEKAENVDKERF